MKKIILVLLFIVSGFVSFSQQDTLWRGMTATFYPDLYNDSTKAEKMINFYLYFKKDSIVIFNEDRRERSHVIKEVLTDIRYLGTQEVRFYSGRDFRKNIILITVVRDEGYLTHVAISNGTYLVVFHILKIKDGSP